MIYLHPIRFRRAAAVMIVASFAAGVFGAVDEVSAQAFLAPAPVAAQHMLLTDSDGDGASDEAEVAYGSDPNDPTDFPEVQAGPEDTDGDGASDADEIAFGSDPEDPADFPSVQAGPEPDETDTDVTSLPSTGVGIVATDAGTDQLLVLLAVSAAIAATGATVASKRAA